MSRPSKAEFMLKWVLERYPYGTFKISAREVPYLTVRKDEMEMNISYFCKSKMFRIFPDEGDKFDIKTREEVVAFLTGEGEWKEYCHCRYCKEEYDTRDEARNCKCKNGRS